MNGSVQFLLYDSGQFIKQSRVKIETYNLVHVNYYGHPPQKLPCAQKSHEIIDCSKKSGLSNVSWAASYF